MTTLHLTDADEGRHLPGTEPLWGESWYHDWAASDGSYGGYLRLGLYPNQQVVWYWVALVRDGEPLVLLVDHAVPAPPMPADMTAEPAVSVVSDGLRATWTPVESLWKYRITTAGTGIALTDPADELRGTGGGPEVPIGLDLTWQGVAPTFPYAMTTRFEQSAWVSGEVTIGDERIDVHCPGQRDHSWGVRDWWLFGWQWCSGRLDDGTWWHSARSIVPKVDIFQTGYLVRPDMSLEPVDAVGADYELDDEMLPVRGELTVGDLEMGWTAELQAPVLLVSPEGKQSRFPRCTCRFETADGRTGRGWLEYNFPEGVPHLKG